MKFEDNLYIERLRASFFDNEKSNQLNNLQFAVLLLILSPDGPQTTQDRYFLQLYKQQTTDVDYLQISLRLHI